MPAGPVPVPVSEIRRGDHFAEVFLGQTETFLALEDAQPWCSADQPPGYRFKALGHRGPQVFYCATGWETYGPKLYRLPPPEALEDGGSGDKAGAGPHSCVATTPPSAPAGPEIVIIAENVLWVRGLISACAGLGTAAGWTAHEWLAPACQRRCGTAPGLVVQHCGQVLAGPDGMAAEVLQQLRRRWPEVSRVIIADEPEFVGEAGECCLPQAIAVERLRAAVSALLAGGQLAAGSER